MRLIYVLMFMLAFLRASIAQDVPAYSVCELLANARAFQGRLVKVTGVAAASEGSWLPADHCNAPVKEGELSLAKALFLTYQSSRGAKVKPNMTHIAKVIRDEERLLAHGAKSIEVTYTGIFETRDKWMIIQSLNGQRQILGLGHDNGFPAQLVVLDISDPKVVRK